MRVFLEQSRYADMQTECSSWRFLRRSPVVRKVSRREHPPLCHCSLLTKCTLCSYQRAIHEYDPNKLYQAPPGSNISATLFVTAPASNVGTPVQGFCQEILASGILTIAVLALGDEASSSPLSELTRKGSDLTLAHAE